MITVALLSYDVVLLFALLYFLFLLVVHCAHDRLGMLIIGSLAAQDAPSIADTQVQGLPKGLLHME